MGGLLGPGESRSRVGKMKKRQIQKPGQTRPRVLRIRCAGLGLDLHAEALGLLLFLLSAWVTHVFRT